ncbi:hypothetical protein GW756_04885 [bacterium]|nr:hypothetical protein [bacterium]NCQ55713.1 hypothetical protein [Candidatus Parcubacteria bacterium]NCS67662.1 hypothetical protein [Candidatus Peregrinibacteria bacterium]NCS96676.1 hypothetical protein [bacterium]
MSLGASTGPESSQARFGTLEYYQEALNSETTWRRLDAARSLADKAAENFERVLKEDYQTTLGVEADDQDYDEMMIAEVQAECESLYEKILRDLQTSEPNDANRAKGYTGGYMSPVIGLFKIATLDSTDPFLDIAVMEEFTLQDAAQSTTDGVFDKYGFDIDNALEREMAIRAIMSEADTTLYNSEVRT